MSKSRTSAQLFIAALLCVLFLLAACKHEPDVIPAPVTQNTGNGIGNGNGNGSGNTPQCDPDTSYFQNDVLPLFISNCAMSGCHDAGSHREGIVLDSYQNIMATGNIRPFRMDGKVMESITTSDPGDRMPPDPASPLSSSQIATIQNWITQGAQNNVCTAGSCDTSNITYSGVIVPMMQNQCTGCHSTANPRGGINLETYAGVQSVAMDGRLFGSINRDAGYSPMPKGGNRMSDCEIAQVRIWIQNGALNN